MRRPKNKPEENTNKDQSSQDDLQSLRDELKSGGAYEDVQDSIDNELAQPEEMKAGDPQDLDNGESLQADAGIPDETTALAASDDEARPLEEIIQPPRTRPHPGVTREFDTASLSGADEGDQLVLDAANEKFVQDITASLADDPFLVEEPAPQESAEPQIEETTDEPKDYVADIEDELDKAEFAKNPFVTDPSASQDDFMSRLNNLFPENYNHPGVTKPIPEMDEISEGDHNLSQASWQDMIKEIEEQSSPHLSSVFQLGQAVSDDMDSLSPFNDTWGNTPAGLAAGLDNLVGDEMLVPQRPGYATDPIDEEPLNDEDSYDTLRRSFIQEFESEPWQNNGEQPAEKTSWLRGKWISFRNWIRSLNTAEKVLLLMSSIISLAVIVAIALVFFDWQSNRVSSSTPPAVIDAGDPNLVYPTGLQLPGGWFFFLQQGELLGNRWEPQTAEWLSSTTLRRLIAIPWSRQAEAVVRTLESGDELRIFMNNNDIMSYYVEEVVEVSRDNVEVLTDNEPSLAVILFREDNADRLVIVAKP